MEEYYNIVASEKKELGRFEVIYDVIEKNGHEHPYSYVKMKNGVGVLGFVEDSVILLHQYRYIWGKWLWEIPGGMVEENETPEEAAIRELEEESGFLVKSIQFLGTCYPSIGSTTEIQYLYAAECEGKCRQKLDSLERIKCSLVNLNEFERMIRTNEFCHGMGLAAWARYQEKENV